MRSSTMDNLLPTKPLKALFAYTICLLNLIPTIQAADPTFLFLDCPNTTSTYAPNSTYQTNLKTLFHVLSSASTIPNGFSSASTVPNGFFKYFTSPPNIAYGFFLCRGDVSAAVCRDCVAYASTDIVKQCPTSKRATIWYDECMLGYSNQTIEDSIFPVAKIGGGVMWNLQNVTNVTRLNEVLGEVMDDIANRASSGNSEKKFATREANYSLLQPVYGLAQCTPDLSKSQCNTCLRNCISQFPSCCNAKQGGRILFYSCNVRYEMYPFYDASVGAAPPPPLPVLPPPPPPPPPTIRSRGNKGKQIAIGVSVSASVVVAFLGSGIYYQRRRKRTAEEDKEYNQEVQLLDLAQGRLVDDYSTGNLQAEKPPKSQDFPSIQLDLVLAVTKHFSEENKLGEGGFGPVYKAWNLWCKGEEILELMDPLLMESCIETEVLKCIHIGLSCVQEDPADRPTMSTVAATLVSDNVTLPQPTQPAFSVGRSVLKSLQSSQIANIVSQNEMTISDASPR